ncbi:MAG: hypothetical protein H0V89_05365 [Deltaproteobacteria bacterium]|nr:hypothetical protein [Deltaproteobacteria bacterium]
MAAAGAMVLALMAPVTAHAGTIGGDHRFGLGVGIGNPTAVSGKLYLGGDINALDFQVGAWDNYQEGYGYDNLYVHVVYLWHPSIVAEGNNFEMPWHIGIGGAVWEGQYCGWGDGFDFCGGDDDFALAARVPVGLDFNIQDPRIQIFGDIALNVLVFPGIGIDLGLQIGARYYF